MNQQEVANFAPPKGAVRDEKAKQQIADFKAKFEATHGGANNAPNQAKAPGG